MAEWEKDIEAAIYAVVGEQVSSSVRARWEAHEARELVEITLVGPYDSGKSTLLKRLLKEGGVPVPAWLTVSARRETWDTNEVDARGVSLTDTPGFAAGDAEHDRIAAETLTLTDALLVVLPPQLMTGERDTLAPILNGRFFSPTSGWRFPRGAIRVVLARLDEGGLDPHDDEDAFSDFVATKHAEMRQLLASIGADDNMPVSPVIADPYGLAGNDSTEYQTLGEVDGIAALLRAISGLVPRRDELRSAARVRYLLHAGHEVLSVIDRHIAHTELQSDELERRAQDQRTATSEVETLVSAAGAALRSDLTDEALAVAEQSPARERLEELLRSRLEARSIAWAGRWNEQLSELADRLQERYEATQDRPMADALEDLFLPPADPEVDERPDGRTTFDLLREAGPILEGGLQQALQLKLGMSLEEAHAELERLCSLDPTTRAEELGGGSSPLTPEDLEYLGPIIRGAMVAATLGPIVLQIAEELLAVVRGGAAVDAETAQMARRRNALYGAAGKVADSVMDRWREGPDRLLAVTREAASFLEHSRAAMEDDLSHQREGRRKLARLLAEAPEPPS